MLFVGSARLGELKVPGVECVRVASAYEATAEILAASTGVLVVDLRLVRGRHLRLLEIARRMNVEVLAVGTVPPDLTSEDLSGVRMMARADLPEAMQRLAKPPEAAGAPAAVEPPATEPKAAQAEVRPASERAAGRRPEQPPASKPVEQLARGSTEDFDEEDVADLLDDVPTVESMEAQTDNQEAKTADKDLNSGEAKRPLELLSPEELAALLEDEP